MWRASEHPGADPSWNLKGCVTVFLEEKYTKGTRDERHWWEMVYLLLFNGLFQFFVPLAGKNYAPIPIVNLIVQMC